jgi:ribosome-binding factor A
MASAKNNPRTRRVGERIQVELAEILTMKTEDPRLRVLSITGVTVTRDLSSARIFISGSISKEDEAAVKRALAHATPYFRSLLAPRLRLRIVPELHFEFDRAIETGNRIEQLLRELREKRDD